MATQASAGAGEWHVSMELSISMFSAHLISSAVPHYDIVTALLPSKSQYRVPIVHYPLCREGHHCRMEDSGSSCVELFR
jgi:hypothetical protein